MGVQDGGGDPWGVSHTVFSVGPLSQASDTHWKHMCLLATNHTSEKSLKSRYLYSLFRSQELTDSHAQRVGVHLRPLVPGQGPRLKHRAHGNWDVDGGRPPVSAALPSARALRV